MLRENSLLTDFVGFLSFYPYWGVQDLTGAGDVGYPRHDQVTQQVVGQEVPELQEIGGWLLKLPIWLCISAAKFPQGVVQMLDGSV